MTDTYRKTDEGWELAPTVEREVALALLGAADEIQRRHRPIDSMRPAEYYAAYGLWWMAEGIKNHYGQSSPPPHPYV